MPNPPRCGLNGCDSFPQRPPFNPPSVPPMPYARNSGSDSCSGLICNSGNVGSPPGLGWGGVSTSPNTRACCLASDTAVLLSNGSEKAASDVTYGDRLEGLSEGGCPREQTVVAITESVEPCLRIELEGLPAIVCTPPHPFASFTGGWIAAEKLQAGDHLVGADREPVKILSVTACGEQQVHIWTCIPDHVFIAGGVVHHNIFKPAIPTNDGIV